MNTTQDSTLSLFPISILPREINLAITNYILHRADGANGVDAQSLSAFARTNIANYNAFKEEFYPLLDRGMEELPLQAWTDYPLLRALRGLKNSYLEKSKLINRCNEIEETYKEYQWLWKNNNQPQNDLQRARKQINGNGLGATMNSLSYLQKYDHLQKEAYKLLALHFLSCFLPFSAPSLATIQSRFITTLLAIILTAATGIIHQLRDTNTNILNIDSSVLLRYRCYGVGLAILCNLMAFMMK